MTKRYLGNIITQNPTAPAGDLADSAAKGVWSLEEQLAYQKAGLWPIPGNFLITSVEDVFSTYLYEGNASGQGATAQSITNDIDLSGEGGLVWIKNRDSGGTSAWSHYLFDTERGATKYLRANITNANGISNNSLSAFNSDGFTLGEAGGTNNNGDSYASWTFRKAPKFFDVVTYNGTGSAQNINHSLGQSPGMIIIKSIGNSENWQVWHRSVTGNLELDNTQALNAGSVRLENVTDTSFGVKTFNTSNGSGQTYVAYLFAHNDGDGGFGPDRDADIIKCGSFTESTSEQEIDLGFEPQWLMIKTSSTTSGWRIFDMMRGFDHGGNATTSNANLEANSDSAEGGSSPYFTPTPTGFTAPSGFFGNGTDYIYMAIRRGPMAVPESGTEVFATDTLGGTAPNPPGYTSGFVTDFGLSKTIGTADWFVGSRLIQGNYLKTNTTGAETSEGSPPVITAFDYNDGMRDQTTVNSSFHGWMWKRAPGYFDVVTYLGDSPGGIGVQTVSHNLGVAPEMIWFKSRDSTSGWGVLATALGTVESGGIELGQGTYINEDSGFNPSGWWGAPYVAPTSTEFTVRGSTPNAGGEDYIAYLFATLAGVSKVGSYTGNGTSQTIDCGFASGARFILIKRTDSAGNWYLWDTEQGIVAGNSPHMTLNTTDAQVTTDDSIDPASSGFIVNQVSATDVNVSSATYIFYAIA